MGKPKLSMVAKAQIATMYNEGKSISQIAKEMKVSKSTVSLWCHRAQGGEMEESLKRKKGSGGVRKIKKETDVILKRLVSEKPRITAKEIKKLHPDVLKDVSVRIIQNHLNKNLNLPSMHAAKKPLLTAAMKAKRLTFCKKYKDWGPDD